MKKIIYKNIAVVCSIALLTAGEQLAAQQYVPFPKANTYWTSAHCEYGPTEYRSGIVKTGIFGDTIIHNKLYHKMYLQTKFVHTGNCTTCDFKFNLDSASYFLAFREKNRKIYVVPTGYNPYGKEYLVYDFTPHLVGDTVKAYPMEFFFAPGQIQSVVSENIKGYPVKSITRVNMSDGSKRKKYTFDPFQLEAWIEGIGSTKFLNPFFQVTDIGDKLLCFSSNGVDFANTTTGQNCELEVYTCEQTTPPINGLSNARATVEDTEELIVYPNPVADHLQLAGLPENGTARIVNILGIEVLAIKAGMKEETVDVSTLSPGIYMLQVCDAQGNCTVKRLVKE
jgi:hypothetical protein